MNKIFKTMRNKNGVETVVSELAKGNKKGLNMSILASALMLSLFSIPILCRNRFKDRNRK